MENTNKVYRVAEDIRAMDLARLKTLDTGEEVIINLSTDPNISGGPFFSPVQDLKEDDLCTVLPPQISYPLIKVV